MTDEPKTIRIAIPSELPGGLDAQRAGHFGRCACFTLVDVVDEEVRDVEILQNAPHTEGGCMAPVLVLAENNVDAIVVQGIGGRPLMGFNQVGIAVLRAPVPGRRDGAPPSDAFLERRAARVRPRGRLPALTCRAGP